MKIGKINLQDDWLISSDGCFKFNKEYNHNTPIQTYAVVQEKLAVVCLYHYQSANYHHQNIYTWHIRFLYNLKCLHDPFAEIYQTGDATIDGTEQEVKDIIEQFLCKMSKLMSFV